MRRFPIDGMMTMNKDHTLHRRGKLAEDTQMIDRLIKVLSTASIMLAVPVAAFAIPAPIQVPEPATLTMLAAGLGGSAGIYAIRKWIRRK